MVTMQNCQDFWSRQSKDIENGQVVQDHLRKQSTSALIMTDDTAIDNPDGC